MNFDHLEIVMNMIEQEESKLINQKELVRLVATQAEYLHYEVKDILDAFCYVVIKQLEEGNRIKLDDMFTIGVRSTNPRAFVLNGVAGVSQGKKKVDFVTSNILINRLNHS